LAFFFISLIRNLSVFIYSITNELTSSQNGRTLVHRPTQHGRDALKNQGFKGISSNHRLFIASHISYALTVNPKIFVDQIQQFWVNATVSEEDGEQQIKSMVHGKPIVVTKSTIRTHLHLNDGQGISSISTDTLFGELKNMGYEGSLSKFTFYKRLFSPHWKFLIHTIKQCISQSCCMSSYFPKVQFFENDFK